MLCARFGGTMLTMFYSYRKKVFGSLFVDTVYDNLFKMLIYVAVVLHHSLTLCFLP